MAPAQAETAGEGLYPSLLGERMRQLSPRVRTLHERTGLQRYRGEVVAVRGRSGLARLCCWAARLPPDTAGAIEVEIEADARGERWVRRFGGHAMPSRLWAQDGWLCERLGLLRFAFALEVEHGAVRWRVRKVHALGIPLPLSWFDGVSAVESESESRYRYDVRAALPLAGLLVHYRGWLDVD
ncbi:DUF4166 domain-containing protein [Lysobacter silvisoli]|uniref:DUF4166 domain-containing protein n=1 Tax=Lysobacter silvisoli TaxID=2293254 RepID=UPI001E4FD02E|nr:DUF4166 domain-containing protein [Lysobacter silvisoli]